MKKALLYFTLLFCCTFVLVAQNIVEKPDDEEKIKLPLCYLDDAKIRYAADDVGALIRRRKKGFNWPMTKMILMQRGEELYFEIIAIDNGWAKLIEPGEKPYCYILVSGRIFIIMTKEGEAAPNLEKIFLPMDESEAKIFRNSKSKPLGANPRWLYLHNREPFPVVKDSRNDAVLGR